jgi:transcriptional regulator with GAF, ATPase, and Fis domain
MISNNVSFIGMTHRESRFARPEIRVASRPDADISLYDGMISETTFEGIVGQSPALRHVIDLVATVAPTDSTVLLLGETGTGKELIARAIHQQSRRKERPLVKLNCAAIPGGLLESEVFGHERGAFTGALAAKSGRFELADRGTLFLDEVGDIPLELQPKLLRALQEREFERLGSTQTKKVDVRLVAATNCDLDSMIADKKFRTDLFYRLNVFPIRIPPLRERRDDIPLLVRHFTQKYANRMNKDITTISGESLRQLIRWHWPGNIRELENLIERAVILARGTTLEVSAPESPRPRPDSITALTGTSEEQDRVVRVLGRLLDRTIIDAPSSCIAPAIKSPASEMSQARQAEARFDEQNEILLMLRDSNGRVGGANGAAARMGLKRTTLITRMKKLGIQPRRVF